MNIEEKLAKIKKNREEKKMTEEKILAIWEKGDEKEIMELFRYLTFKNYECLQYSIKAHTEKTLAIHMKHSSHLEINPTKYNFEGMIYILEKEK